MSAGCCSQPLTGAHIMAVLVFTNYSLLAHKFVHVGCNPLAADEQYAQTKLRNQEIGHWFRLLKEACLFYGEPSTPQV